MVQRMERDAEVDALRSRLAAAEARAERAVGLLREAEQYGNFGCSDDFHGQIGCASDGGLILRDGWLARIDALLKEVAHGQQGSEMVEEAASALLACLDRHIASLAGLFGDLDLAVDALRAALALPADDAPPGDAAAMREAAAMVCDVALGFSVEADGSRSESAHNAILRRAAASIRALPLPERGAPFAYGVVDGCGDKWDVFRDRVTADFCAANCNAVVTHGKGRPGPFRVVPLYPHPTPRAEAASAEAYAQGVIDGQRHERSLPAAPASAEAAQAEAGTLREQLLAEQGVVIGMRRAARGEFVEPHDAREDAVRDLWRAWSRLASEKAGKSAAEAVATASAEAVREACAKACDERAAESRRMEALCGSAKREWTDLDLQEEVTTEAVECAKACRSLPLPPGQASAGGMVDASLLPLVDGLLRDAEDAIAAHAGPGQHVGTPKVTVDALRLRNAARAVAHALRAKGAK